jgi:hypothetical protein
MAGDHVWQEINFLEGWLSHTHRSIYLPEPSHSAITNGEDIEDLIMTFDLTALDEGI